MSTIEGRIAGGAPRNGLPPAKPYVYRGTGTEMSPAEIVKHLRRQIIEQQYAQLLPVEGAVEATRQDLAMCPPCLADFCRYCEGEPCKCACQDEPPHAAAAAPEPPPPPVFCPDCGYRTTAPGHKITCGEAS